MSEPYYTCCEDGMLSQVPPTDRSGLCPKCSPGKPTCAVRGVVYGQTGRLLGMCRHVIVGNKLCGFAGQCEHQRPADDGAQVDHP